MARKTTNKAKQLSTESAANHSGSAVKINEAAVQRAQVQMPPAPAVPAKATAPQDPLVPPPQSPKPAPVQAEPTKLQGKAVVAEAPVLSAVPTVKVTFVFPICECCPKRVSLSGDFNGWSPDATPMKRYDDGHWETTVELAPGRYEYKFVRDGEWMPDLLASENVLNRHGTLNSVIEVRA